MSVEEKDPQRFRTDVAQCAEAQVKRRSGNLIRSINDYYDVIPSLRPEYILYGHPKRLRHLLKASARFGESLAFLTP